MLNSLSECHCDVWWSCLRTSSWCNKQEWIVFKTLCVMLTFELQIFKCRFQCPSQLPSTWPGRNQRRSQKSITGCYLWTSHQIKHGFKEQFSHHLLPPCWWKFRWSFVVHKTFLVLHSKNSALPNSWSSWGRKKNSPTKLTSIQLFFSRYSVIWLVSFSRCLWHIW